MAQMSEAAREVIVKTLGITVASIDAAIATPDETDVLQFDGGLTINVYSKKASTVVPSVLVVVETIQPTRAVDIVLRVYNDFPREIDTCTPIELVEQVARRFGAELSVGSVRDQFFLRRDIPTASATGGNPISFHPGKRGHEYHFVSHFRVSDTSPPMVSCALVLALDVTSYQKYLRRWAHGGIH